MSGRIEIVAGRATPHWIELGGVSLLADPDGALFHEGERALLVADLHLEKGSAFARRGQMLPPFDTAATLAKLAALLMRHRPRTVIALGDSFHDSSGFERMGEADRDALRAAQAGRDWVWIAGNHDPDVPEEAGGERAAEMRLGPLVLRHEPSPLTPTLSPQAGRGGRSLPSPNQGVNPATLASPLPVYGERDRVRGEESQGAQAEIAGHFHPVAKVGGMRRRCFVTDGTRLVMPAFGSYAGGLNLHDAAISSLFTGRRIAHVLGRDRIYAICASRCARD